MKRIQEYGHFGVSRGDDIGDCIIALLFDLKILEQQYVQTYHPQSCASNNNRVKYIFFGGAFLFSCEDLFLFSYSWTAASSCYRGRLYSDSQLFLILRFLVSMTRVRRWIVKSCWFQLLMASTYLPSFLSVAHFSEGI